MGIFVTKCPQCFELTDPAEICLQITEYITHQRYVSKLQNILHTRDMSPNYRIYYTPEVCLQITEWIILGHIPLFAVQLSRSIVGLSCEFHNYFLLSKICVS